jgi:hypothetical protein
LEHALKANLRQGSVIPAMALIQQLNAKSVLSLTFIHRQKLENFFKFIDLKFLRRNIAGRGRDQRGA